MIGGALASVRERQRREGVGEVKPSARLWLVGPTWEKGGEWEKWSRLLRAERE